MGEAVPLPVRVHGQQAPGRLKRAGRGAGGTEADARMSGGLHGGLHGGLMTEPALADDGRDGFEPSRTEWWSSNPPLNCAPKRMWASGRSTSDWR